MQWRTRLSYFALIVGVACGLVCSAYTIALDMIIEAVWEKELPALFTATLGGLGAPSWVFMDHAGRGC